MAGANEREPLWWRKQGARQLQRILNEWDPIGIASPEHEDEYDSYLHPVFSA